jgi:hypothetical protein
MCCAPLQETVHEPLLGLAVNAHGGMARWQQVKRIHLQLSMTWPVFVLTKL